MTGIETAKELLLSAKEEMSEDDFIEFIEDLRQATFELSPLNSQPVDRIHWVDINMVQANDYNPNSVAGQEMSLLYTSILHDGYTQPVVTIWDEDINKYVIVDGFHRYFTCKNNQDIKDRNHGRLPIVDTEEYKRTYGGYS